MPYTVPVAFDALLDNLALTSNQEALATARFSHVLTYFTDGDIDCSEYPFKIGSYERGTVIRWRRDVDIMVAIRYANYKARYDEDPDGMLRWLRDRLNKEYGSTTVTRSGVAIRMLLGEGMQVDLVPTFSRTGGGYFMPSGRGGWQATNPPYHAKKMTDTNVALDSKLKPLVRVMKAWNEANNHHLESFHLEMMVWKMWNDAASLPALPQAVADTLRKLVTWIRYSMRDPWSGAGKALDTYLSADKRALVGRLAEADHKHAEEALAYAAAGNNKEAYERWGVVFNGKFPAYG
jgi:hypothetical protein